jgi:peptidoglycan/xylan/chitin deacetylase (PgdA/CDA1 family)
MAGYREKFIKTLSLLGSVIPSQLLINITKQRLIVPVYHLISDEPVDHVRHLYAIKKVKSFIEDLDFLLKNYTPIDYFTLENLIANNKNPNKNSFILTFDDGLREFHDVIAPILLQKGVPAICFLNSDFIDNKKIFYRYKASLLINAFSDNEKFIKYKSVLNWIKLHSFNNQNNIRSIILSINFQHQQALNDLAQLIDLDFNQYLLDKQPYLTSNQVFALKDKGFYFGSHSCNHPEYRFLSLADQIQQTKVSIEKISNQFTLPYKAFAFPFTDYGVSKDFFQIIHEEEHLVDCSFGCAGLKLDTFPRHIQRIPLEMANLSAKEIVNTEYIYYLFKSFLGKNAIIRK